MKQIVGTDIGGYAFNKTAGTVVFSSMTAPTLSQILMIHNATTGVTIYDPFDTTKLGTIAGSTLTLDFDTSSMTDADKLLIIVDYASLPIAVGKGAFTAVPAGTTNGTAIGVAPSGAVGVRLYLQGSDSVTFTIQSSAPGSAPSLTFAATVASVGSVFDENLASGQMLYITAIVGSPMFRWY